MAADSRYVRFLTAISAVAVASTLLSLVDGGSWLSGRAFGNITIGACCFNASCQITNQSFCTDVNGGFHFNQSCAACMPQLPPTSTPTTTPTDTPTATPTNTPTATPTSTPSATPSVTATASPSATASNTPTRTPVPQGGSCMNGGQCRTGFCSDGVCCDQACTGADQHCNAQGICVSVAAAPVVSRAGMLLIVGLLAAIAGVGVLRRRGAWSRSGH